MKTLKQNDWIKQDKNILIYLGMIGGAFFIIGSMVDGATRKGYNPYFHWISHLSLGDRNWFAISSTIIVGLMILGFASGLRQLKIQTIWGIRLFNLLGIALILSAIFVMDPLLGYPPGVKTTLTLRGRIHDFSAMFIFISQIALCFVWGKWFYKIPLKKWSLYSKIMGILILTFFLIYLLLAILALLKILPNAPTGLFERLTMYTSFLWIISFSYWLVKLNR